MTTEREVAPEKRAQILEATIRLLTEKGLSGLKVEDVARAAEVGKGTVYLYFEDKQSLLRALVEQRTRQFYTEAERVTAGPGSFDERLRRLVAARLSFIEEWRGLWGAVAREASDEADWLVRLHETYQGILERFVAYAVDGGELPPVDVRLAASLLTTLGLPQLPVDLESFIDFLCSVLLGGFRSAGRGKEQEA